jgi:hypothetical protein
MAGIATADAGWLGAALITAFIGTAAGAFVLVMLGPRWLGVAGVAAGALVGGLVLGGIRGTAAAPPAGPGSVETLPTDAAWLVSGVVADEPTPRGDALDLVLEELSIEREPVAGRLLVPSRGRRRSRPATRSRPRSASDHPTRLTPREWRTANGCGARTSELSAGRTTSA